MSSGNSRYVYIIGIGEQYPARGGGGVWTFSVYIRVRVLKVGVGRKLASVGARLGSQLKAH